MSGKRFQGGSIAAQQARRGTGEMSRDYADAMPDGDLTVECDQFLGGLLNSFYRKAA